VEHLSRVTGYIQAVSGWNEGKKQELKDRKRYGWGCECDGGIPYFFK